MASRKSASKNEVSHVLQWLRRPLWHVQGIYLWDLLIFSSPLADERMVLLVPSGLHICPMHRNDWSPIVSCYVMTFYELQDHVSSQKVCYNKKNLANNRQRTSGRSWESDSKTKRDSIQRLFLC